MLKLAFDIPLPLNVGIGGNVEYPKIKKLKKFVLISEPAQKCDNNVIFTQNLAINLLIAFKMTYSCCFSLGGYSKFSRFPPKNSFMASTTCWLYSHTINSL